MNCEKVITLMKQNISALKEIEELIAYNKKQQEKAVSPEELERLTTYINTMKGACETAVKLATHYKESEKKIPEPKAAEPKLPKPSTAKAKQKSGKEKLQVDHEVDEFDDSEFEDLLK